MDEIDAKQQREIEALQKENKDQDFWIKLLAVGIVGWLMLATTIMMIKLTHSSGPVQDIHTQAK